MSGSSRMSVRALTTSEERWIEKHGMDQLDQLNAMERGQDSTTWSTNALHSATNGVLIVASVTALNHPDWWILLVLLGILGSFISTAWFLIIISSAGIRPPSFAQRKYVDLVSSRTASDLSIGNPARSLSRLMVFTISLVIWGSVQHPWNDPHSLFLVAGPRWKVR